MLEHTDTESQNQPVLSTTEEETEYRFVPALSLALGYFQRKIDADSAEEIAQALEHR